MNHNGIGDRHESMRQHDGAWIVVSPKAAARGSGKGADAVFGVSETRLSAGSKAGDAGALVAPTCARIDGVVSSSVPEAATGVPVALPRLKGRKAQARIGLRVSACRRDMLL